MKVLIVEDETAASENLVAMLIEYDSSIEVLKVLESLEQTMCWLSTNPNPDLIFMDIHLSDGLAFNLFEEMEVTVPIIFTTAYDRYALEAFKVNSLDYLLKPIKTSELERALNKYIRWSQSDMKDYIERMIMMKPNNPECEYKSLFLVTVNDKILPIKREDIVCFYSKERNTQLFTKNNQVYQYNRSLDSILLELNPVVFYRANKQFIIAKESVKEMEVSLDSRLKITLTVKTPETIYVSKNKAFEFKNWMMK